MFFQPQTASDSLRQPQTASDSRTLGHSIVISPSHFNFISAEALCESALVQGHSLPAIIEVLEEASVGDHCSIIYTVAVIHGTDRTTSFCSHRSHHLLQTQIAADTADK